MLLPCTSLLLVQALLQLGFGQPWMAANPLRSLWGRLHQGCGAEENAQGKPALAAPSGFGYCLRTSLLEGPGPTRRLHLAIG